MTYLKRNALAIVCALALGACSSSDDTEREGPTTSVQPRPTATTTTRATESAACNTTADAARAAAAVHFAATGSFPRTFADMTRATPPELELPKGIAQSDTTLRQDPDWELNIEGGGSAAPTFTCTALRPLPSMP